MSDEVNTAVADVESLQHFIAGAIILTSYGKGLKKSCVFRKEWSFFKTLLSCTLRLFRVPTSQSQTDQPVRVRLRGLVTTGDTLYETMGVVTGEEDSSVFYEKASTSETMKAFMAFGAPVVTTARHRKTNRDIG